MNFSRGHSEQKFNVNRAFFPKEKTPEFTKMGEIHELFRFGPFFGLVCRGDSLFKICSHDENSEIIISLCTPHCAIPRDYLSDTPLLRAMGFLVSQHGQLGAIPPLPSLSVSSLESMRKYGKAEKIPPKFSSA